MVGGGRALSLLAAAFWGLGACAGIPRAGGWPDRARVDAGPYSVVVPVGDGWRVRIDRDEAAVLCSRSRRAFPAGLVRETRYLVRQMRVPQAARGLEPRALASALAEAEADTLAEGQAQGEYVLRDVHRALHRAGGRLVHLVDFEAAAVPEAEGFTIQGRLLLYAPADLLADGVYYVIMVTDAFRTGAADPPVALRAADALVAGLRPH